MSKAINKDYRQYIEVHKLSFAKENRQDFDDAREVFDNYIKSWNARKTSCYWWVSSENINGGDWARIWDIQEKQWMMWYKPQVGDQFRSNVKSPMTTGRIESTFQKLKKWDIKWVVRPTNSDDVGKAVVIQKLLDFEFQRDDMRESLMKWFHDTLIHGTGICRIYHTKEKRKYSFPKNKANDVSKDEIKTLKTGKTVWGDPKEVIKYEGLVIEPVPLFEFFPDPQAREIHSRTFNCRYVIRERIMGYDDFKQEYEDNPDFRNVEKVQPATAYNVYREYRFFRAPVDLTGDNVRVLEYENQLTDKYIITANDVVIYSAPLPYNHKELTYHKIDIINNPYQFYGLGFADLLRNLQGTEEIQINMMMDHIFRSINTKHLVEESVFGEMSETLARDDDWLIPIRTDGQPLSSKVFPMPVQPISFDAFRMLDTSKEMATMATQINPSQMNLQQASSTATATMISKEIVDTMLNCIMDNFALAMTKMGRQAVSIERQMETVAKVKKITGEDKKEEIKKIYKQIRLEGYQLTDKGKNQVEIKRVNDPYTFFEVKEEYLNTTSDLDYSISAESMQILSKGLEMQKAREMYAQLLPNAVDPGDPAKVAQHPLPLYDAVKLAQYYAQVNEVPEEVLLKPSKDKLEELQRAEEQTKLMLNTPPKAVAGVPGEAIEHQLYHSMVLDQITNQIDNLKIQMDEQMKSMPMQFDQMGMAMPPQPDQATQARLMQLMKWKQIVANHLEIDKLPIEMEIDAGLMKAKQGNQPQQSPNPQIPMPVGARTPVPNPNNVPMSQPISNSDIMPGINGTPAQ